MLSSLITFIKSLFKTTKCAPVLTEPDFEKFYKRALLDKSLNKIAKVLKTIMNNNEEYISVNQIALACNLTSASVSSILSKLYKDGFFERLLLPDNKSYGYKSKLDTVLMKQIFNYIKQKDDVTIEELFQETHPYEIITIAHLRAMKYLGLIYYVNLVPSDKVNIINLDIAEPTTY